jgi:mannose-6-phosphate isomerase-like protein (cupin superfamily)
MIKKSKNMEVEVRKDMRGGKGDIKIIHYFKKDEIKAKCRLCAKLLIPPGASIGLHPHNEEDEIFIITKGKGIINEGNSEYPVEPGDATLTKSGEEHSIRNSGDEDLEVIAVIIMY